MTQRFVYFDGMKSVNINNLPEEAWTILNRGYGSSDMSEKYAAVPWLWRGTELRAQAVSTLPFAIVRPDNKDDPIDTSEDYQNAVEFLPRPVDLLYLIEASLILQGKAYLFKSRNAMRPLDLRYMLASSIKPLFDRDEGLVGFERRLENETRKLAVEDIIYFWLRDPFTEIGPPGDDKCPGQAALQAAGVLYNLDDFAQAFFERGAIKATLLKYPVMPPAAEQARIKAWWKRVFSGIKNAFAAQIMPADTEVEVIGEGIGELADTDLTTTMREDISTALGIPHSLLFSNAANFATAAEDDKHFYSKTVVPEARFIQGVLNDQLFKPLELQFEFRPENLDVFQEDQGEQSESYQRFIQSSMRPSVAAQIVGIELPPGIEYEDLDRMREEDQERQAERMAQQRPAFGNPQNPQRNQQGAQQKAMLADLRAWRTKARRAGGPVPFESEYIPAKLMLELDQRLAICKTDAEIRDLFDVVIQGKALRIIPEGANEPLPPVPDVVEITEADIDKALALWDELMPEYRGMLGATVEGRTEFAGEQY